MVAIVTRRIIEEIGRENLADLINRFIGNRNLMTPTGFEKIS